MHKQHSWQQELSEAFKDPRELFDFLELDHKLLNGAYQAIKTFALRVPRGYAARMQKANPHDPLLRQVLPLRDELIAYPGYVDDPLKEKKANPLPGLLHKYHGRVLLTLTSACAIHCRYCFRRHFPYADNNPGREGWKNIAAYIADNSSIEEIILSGGDPLTVSDQLLEMFSDEIKPISHVKRLRIHTRLPIVLPARITDAFCAWLSTLPWQYIVVVHANHGNEIDESVKTALLKIRSTGATVLNQSVLLKGINDDANILAQLSKKLFAADTIPYYLHLLDKISGAQHFDVELDEALIIYKKLQCALPGYLVPRLVREEPGAECKTVIAR